MALGKTTMISYNFQEMLPLEVLAAVATETLKQEINTSPKTKSNYPYKEKKAKIATTKDNAVRQGRLSLDEILAMSDRVLIENFSMMTSDELNKKYSYKCFLMPEKCTMTFRSFGSEGKARSQIKLHLVSHLNDMVALRDMEDITFSAEPLVSRKRHSIKKSCSSKPSKMIGKKPRSQFEKNFMKVSNLTSKVFSNNNHSSNESHSIFKKAELDIMFGNEEEVCDNNDMNYADFNMEGVENITNAECLVLDENDVLNSKIAVQEPTEDSINRECVKEAPDEINEVLKVDSQPSMSNVFTHDHNYTTINGPTFPTGEYSKTTGRSRKNIPITLDIEPQFIIKTPPFPYVYVPLLPEISEIKEIQDCGEPVFAKFCDISTEDMEQEQNNVEDENTTVLECVENKVTLDECVEPIAENIEFDEENDGENYCKNIQSIEKELALKLIGSLRTKKKNYGMLKNKTYGSLKCRICNDKTFTAQSTLMHHYRSHAGIKPYLCTICNATFTRQHSLNYHMLIHRNLCRFVCNDCGRTFRHPSHYKEHLRRHTGETPYHCSDCNSHFKTRNTFKRHLKTRHGRLLTAYGIQQMSNEEFCKIRTNPRVKKKPSI